MKIAQNQENNFENLENEYPIFQQVVHCVGTIQTYRTKLGTSNGSMTRCLLAVGTPLLSNASFEVPVDRQTFVTKHSLDLKLSEVDDL